MPSPENETRVRTGPGITEFDRIRGFLLYVEKMVVSDIH